MALIVGFEAAASVDPFLSSRRGSPAQPEHPGRAVRRCWRGRSWSRRGRRRWRQEPEALFLSGEDGFDRRARLGARGVGLGLRRSQVGPSDAPEKNPGGEAVARHVGLVGLRGKGSNGEVLRGVRSLIRPAGFGGVQSDASSGGDIAIGVGINRRGTEVVGSLARRNQWFPRNPSLWSPRLATAVW